MAVFETFELPAGKQQKSFNKKAFIIEGEFISYLKSYNTIVGEYNHETSTIKLYGYYSETTKRHQNAFLKYFGFDFVSKKDLIDKSPGNPFICEGVQK